MPVLSGEHGLASFHLTLLLHTSCLKPFHHVLLRQKKGCGDREEWSKVHSMKGKWCLYYHQPAQVIHCTSSFLQPPTEQTPEGKGRHSLLCLLILDRSPARLPSQTLQLFFFRFLMVVVFLSFLKFYFVNFPF